MADERIRDLGNEDHNSGREGEDRGGRRGKPFFRKGMPLLYTEAQN